MTSLATTTPALGGGDDRSTALADRLLGALSLVRRNGRRLAARPVELAPLTGAQLELVRLVRRRPGTSVAEAAAELHLAANTVSTLVGQLVEEGLVERLTDATDRRVARLQLRPEIRRKVDAWRDRRMMKVADAISRLPAADRRSLLRAATVLERLAGELEEEPG